MDDRLHRGGQRLDVDPSADDQVALRDAAGIVERAEADETAARSARERFRHGGLDGTAPDATIGPLLGCEERVFAMRSAALFERRLEPAPAGGIAGDLYVTSRRLVIVGRRTISIPLEDIQDAVISGNRLLLQMSDGAGMALDVNQPRLLRVEIAAARRARRR